MMTKGFPNSASRAAALAVLLLGLAAPSFCATFNLKAESFTKTIGGESIVFWGFNRQVPGPVLRVPPGDSTLIVNVENTLPVPVSLVIPGLYKPMTPVKITDAVGRERVVSFDAAVPAKLAPNQRPTATYQWNNVRPGSYVYHSGYDPSIQVQMGLYGAVLKNSAAGAAYPGYPFNNEAVLVYSEVDTTLHAAVAAAVAGTAPYTFPSAIDFQPKYYLLNGNIFPDTVAEISHKPVAGETMVLRFLNAGLTSVVPTTIDAGFKVIAEDANVYPYAKDQYGVMVAAGRTKDAIYTVPKGRLPPIIRARVAGEMASEPPPAEITVPVYDRSLRAEGNAINVGENNQAAAGGGGGGLCFLGALSGAD